jgi:hypothetical protein
LIIKLRFNKIWKGHLILILVLGKIGFASPLKNSTLNNSEMSTNAVDENVRPSFTLGDPTYSRMILLPSEQYRFRWLSSIWFSVFFSSIRNSSHHNKLILIEIQQFYYSEIHFYVVGRFLYWWWCWRNNSEKENYGNYSLTIKS